LHTIPTSIMPVPPPPPPPPPPTGHLESIDPHDTSATIKPAIVLRAMPDCSNTGKPAKSNRRGSNSVSVSESDHSRQCSTGSIHGVSYIEIRGRQKRGSSSAQKVSRQSTTNPDVMRHGPLLSSAEIFDVLEREQEGIVNKLQREITHLKCERSRSRSHSTSSSSSISRQPSVRSMYSASDAEDISQKQTVTPRGSNRTSVSISGPDENNLVQSLRKENELLKKKLADLSIKRKCMLLLYDPPSRAANKSYRERQRNRQLIEMCQKTFTMMTSIPFIIHPDGTGGHIY
jgi:hypothetical protein